MLTRTKAMLNRSDAAVDELSSRLQQIGAVADTATRLQIEGLLDWLRTQRQDNLNAERDARRAVCARRPVQTAGRQGQGDAERTRIPGRGP